MTKEFAPTLACAACIAYIMSVVTLDLNASAIVLSTFIVPIKFPFSPICDVALAVVAVAVPASCAEILDIPEIPIAVITPTIIPKKCF